jgi:hypothetical protein
MEFRTHTLGDRRIAEVVHNDIVFTTVSGALDLLGNAYYHGFDGLVVHVHQLPEGFFDLANGMAGEVLQKFSNYRMPVAIVGDLSPHPSAALQAFIRESNQGRQVHFRRTVEEAMGTLFQAGR